MFRPLILGVAAPLAVAATLFSPGSAAAANRFAVVSLENTTQLTIKYQYRWGDDQWVNGVMKPGERKQHWFPYAKANENKSPRFNVRFDSDFSQKDFQITYSLKKNAAPAHDFEDGHKYVFQYDGNKTFVDLRELK